MENHENPIVHTVTLIFPNFSEDRACADLVGKIIILLVTYLPPVTLLSKGHFPIVFCSIDYFSCGIFNWIPINGVLKVAT